MFLLVSLRNYLRIFVNKILYQDIKYQIPFLISNKLYLISNLALISIKINEK